MSCLDLSGVWSFSFSDSGDLESFDAAAFPCAVPGNFELDLSGAGLFEGDPFHGQNIAKLRSYERCHVRYFRHFATPELNGRRAVLVFEGLDCIADVYINGTLAGSTDNMLIEHEMDVTNLLKDENEILVHISPPAERAKSYAYPVAVGSMPHLAESVYIRKAPHCYGWDIMPRAVSAGIWRPVYLELREDVRIDRVYLATASVAQDHSHAKLLLRYNLSLPLDPDYPYSVRLRGRCGDSEFDVQRRVIFGVGQIEFKVDAPDLWWPRGRGAASLYEITVELLRGEEVVDNRQFRHGIRVVELQRTDTTDAAGSGEFCFYVNHERIFAKGTNWVPLDAYHSRDFERIPRVLDLVEDINCNMVRCWGGNVYENDLFYDLCDEKGILVWQDFAMACAIYPQDLEFQERLRKEAVSVVRRLRNHACLTLWAGDNECDEFWLGSPARLDPNDNVLTRQVLPSVLREEDPFRPYLPSSPYLSKEVIAKGLSSMPEAHLWGVRHNFRASYYKDTACHFVSESGFLASPSLDSLKKFLPEDGLWPYAGNPNWTLHCTSPIPGIDLFDYRVELLAMEAETLFGARPESLDDFIFATQAFQAEGMKFMIERFRSEMWRRTGVLWWNMMDGWPQFSDAVVDYYFGRKLAYDFVKRAQEPVTVVLRENSDSSLSVVGVNETPNCHSLSFCVTDMDGGGVVTERSDLPVQKEASIELLRLPNPGADPGMYRIDWSDGVRSSVNHYLYGNAPYDLEVYKARLRELYG